MQLFFFSEVQHKKYQMFVEEEACNFGRPIHKKDRVFELLLLKNKYPKEE